MSEPKHSRRPDAAALAAAHDARPVKLRLPRKADIAATGKRHPFLFRYEAGFDETGRILALDALLAADHYFATPGVTVRHIRQWQPFLT